jgi:hypothetical protein
MDLVQVLIQFESDSSQTDRGFTVRAVNCTSCPTAKQCPVDRALLSGEKNDESIDFSFGPNGYTHQAITNCTQFPHAELAQSWSAVL